MQQQFFMCTSAFVAQNTKKTQELRFNKIRV